MALQISSKSKCDCSQSIKDETSNKVKLCATESLSTLVPANNSQLIKRTSQKGLRVGWTRVTFILKEEHVERLKSLAYWERSTIKDIVDEALSMYLENTKKKIIKKEL